MIFPVKGSYTVTAVFGQTGRYWKDGHKGTDFVSDDKNVYAATGGRVRVVAYDPSGWGNYVSVGDKDGYRHLYCHLQSVSVTIGQELKEGDVIGVMGRSGNASGVHLHYQINTAAGAALDPMTFLNKEAEFMYSDDEKISPWAKQAVYAAREKGYLVGDTDGRFRPDEPLTREQAAVLIMNYERKHQNG